VAEAAAACVASTAVTTAFMMKRLSLYVSKNLVTQNLPLPRYER
jgi:hypothetical protein